MEKKTDFGEISAAFEKAGMPHRVITDEKEIYEDVSMTYDIPGEGKAGCAIEIPGGDLLIFDEDGALLGYGADEGIPTFWPRGGGPGREVLEPAPMAPSAEAMKRLGGAMSVDPQDFLP